MRLAAFCIVMLLSAGCDDRSSFDKQYDETANDIQNRAARIDTDLNTTTTESAPQGDNASEGGYPR